MLPTLFSSLPNFLITIDKRLHVLCHHSQDHGTEAWPESPIATSTTCVGLHKSFVWHNVVGEV